MNDREETLRDQIATIIQAGHRDRKTSFEISEEVCARLQKPEDFGRVGRPTIQLIMQIVADYYKLPFSAMTSPIRTTRYAQARQVAMYLARHITKRTHVEIGNFFGGRDHGTVIHAERTIEDRVSVDPAFRGELALVRERVLRSVAEENVNAA